MFLLHMIDPGLGDLVSMGEYVHMVTEVLALTKELWSQAVFLA